MIYFAALAVGLCVLGLVVIGLHLLAAHRTPRPVVDTTPPTIAGIDPAAMEPHTGRHARRDQPGELTMTGFLAKLDARADVAQQHMAAAIAAEEGRP